MKRTKSACTWKKASRTLLVIVLVLIAGQSFAASKTLRLLSSWPETMLFVKGCLGPFNENMEKISNHQMGVQFSGPDVIPAVEQFQPVQSGVFDMLFTIPAYHMGTTGVGSAVDAIDPDPVRRRETGIFQEIDGYYNKLGVKVVAIVPVTDLNFLMRVPIDKNQPSFKGLKIRTIPSVSSLVKSLGGVPVNIAAGEVYTGLQKGVIDGAVVITFGILDLKWHEVTKYLARPTFGHLSTFIFMNLDKYNGLTPAEKQMIDQAGKQTELDAVKFFQDKKAWEEKELKGLGMQETAFQGDDARRLNQLFNESIWEMAGKKSPQEVQKIKDFAAAKGMTQ